MKLKGILTALLLAFAWAFVAQADGSLITGKIRVGAYDVEVQNASRTNWVDGELVITYLNTNATVTKSFTLPHQTTGRLLAVGGGGAGGQDSAYSTSAGLPGGGGAGGMVTNDNQAFAAATYTVTVGGGGLAPRKTTRANGANGKDSKLSGGSLAITAKGGGGGGVRGVGQQGGCGGGGSYYSGSKAGGGTNQTSPGFGKKGGTGTHAQYGGGGGGAGGVGGDTAKETTSGGKTTYGHSGVGGVGVFCDITGESVEYARGGDGGVPRVYAYHYYDEKAGREVRTNTQPVNGKINGYRGYFIEASDGKPGLEGRGNGGGGSGHYSSSATFAGSGGGGVVIVRIPPYKTTVEDALKTAFAGQSVTVSGSVVTLNGDSTGPIEIPDNLGAVTIKLNGHAIIGADGVPGDDITPGGDGQSALKIVPHEYDCESGVTILSVTGTGSLKGGSGGKGYPGGAGAAAVAADGFTATVADGITVTAGTAGESYVQHPHKWAYTIKDNKIVAYCVAYDGETCSYRDDHSRGPFVAVSAADAAYTAMRYDELTAVNGITPVTGIVVAPETYVGRDGTDYPESSTPPREQGAYTVNMQLGDLRITSDFTITEPKPSQGSVYQAWKTAERKGRDVQICLSATFDGSKAINDGNVLFLGSRCNAHSMATGTVEKSINAMTRYANVRWYAYGSSDPTTNLVNQLTRKGGKVPYTEKGGKVTDETVHLEGSNHFVHKEMMDDLYAELVENRNHTDGYDLIVLEFDGDLLCRNGDSPYQLVYSLPTGWTDEKAARLRAAMSRYYAEDRVVWIVPDVNQPKSDAGYTGEYPWTSNPEFIWQRAFLNASETEGYKCPLQKNYEDTDELVDYLQEVLVGHFFSNAIIRDKLAEGLTIRKVTPQMRSDGGIWHSFEGGPSRYTIPEPRSGTTVTADVERVERQVTVTFDMKAEQAWACEHDLVIGDDFRVVIDAELDGFFSGVGEGGWQETNEDKATFTFTESNLDDDEEGFAITIEKDSPKIQNVKLTPDYTAEDVVRIYDGKGTNIVVKPIAPEPENAIIRYSLDEHGTYTDNFALTNVCEKTKVWFEITDKNDEFTTVTNFACVTILPLPPEPPQEESMGIEAFDAEKFYDAEPTNVTWVVTNAAGVAITDATISLREKNTTDWIPAADFVPYVDTTNVTVEVKAEKTGFDPVTAEATVLVKPRPVTLVAGSDSKVFDGTPLTCDDFEVKDDDTTAAIPGYGFVNDEGVASVTMTDGSTITLPGSQPNVIATTVAKEGTKLERNYTVTTEPGTLTVTPAAFTASAEPVEKFYDSTPTNIIVTVAGIPAGVTPTYEYSYSETEGFVPAADFTGPTNVSETATVYCRVIIPGTTNVVSATATIKPRIVVSHAKDGEWTFNGQEHAQPDSFEDESEEAKLSKAKWGTDEALPDSTGFVDGEGYAADLVMTDASRITLPGTKPNVIDQTADKTALKPNTRAENYEFHYLDGTLTVTAATMGIAAFPAEKFYDAEPTNITYVVTNATGAAITDATISLREKGTDPWIPAADFVPYVDTTNVTVEVKAEKTGFDPVTAEATVLVKPRPVTLIAASDSKVYDGLPLTTNGFTVAADTVTPGYGFVPGEGVASVTMTDGSTITLPGSQPNVIASETAKEGTKLDRNYVVSTEPGTLTVVPMVPEIPEEVGSGGPLHELPPGTNPPAFDSGSILSTNDWIGFYDGGPHTILTNQIWEAIAENPLYAENNPQVGYSIDGTDWQDVPFEYTDVVVTSFWYRIIADNCSNYYHAAGVMILPRIVVLHAENAFAEYGSTNAFHELRQDGWYEDAEAETNEAVNVYGTNPPDPDSMGFAAGEGVASVPMTADSVLAEPGTATNAIDEAAVTFKEGTNPENYIIGFLPGTLEIIQRQDEVQRDPEIVVPPEAQEVLERKDEETRQILDELVKDDPGADTESFIKYQVTVLPTNRLDETTHTSPEQVVADANEQLKVAEMQLKTVGESLKEMDEVKFLDITLERTYDKSVAEAPTYNQQDWEPMDDAAAHGRGTIVSVTIPVDVPDGMELVAVTRSCHKDDGTVSHGALTKITDESRIGSVEGFVHDPATKTVTLYAYDFCVFGFYFKEDKKPCKGICSWVDLGGAEAEDAKIVYDFSAKVRTTGSRKTGGGKVTNYTVNLGKNKKGEFWYTAPCVWDGSKDKHVDITTLTGKTSRKFAVRGASGTVYKQVLSATYKSKTSPKLKNPPELLVAGLDDEAKADIAAAFGFDGKRTSYAEKSAGVYCQTFDYSIQTPSVCYRVAETRTITGIYVLSACCGVVNGGLFTDADGVLPDLSTVMLIRFGAPTLEKARNVEFVGEIGSDETLPCFCLAGQGEVKTLKDSKKRTAEGINTLSGNIVGSLPPVTCEGCCGIDDQAIVFRCDALDDEDIAWKSEGDEEMMPTAAYGTFTLKFNSKKSSFPVPAN